MDVRFENRTAPDERMIRAYIRRVARTWCIVYSTVFLALIAVSIAFDFPRMDATMLAIDFTAVLVVAYNLTARPFFQARRNIRNRRIVTGSADPVNVVRFGEKIEVTEPNATVTLDYSQIVALYKARRVWCLMLPKRNGLALDPDGFTVGKPAAFEAFLREKCPNLK